MNLLRLAERPLERHPRRRTPRPVVTATTAVTTVPSAERDPGFVARWRDLERRALEPNPFLAPQMLLPAARHLGAPPSLRLVTAEQDGRTVFLLPVADATPHAMAPVPRPVPLRRAGVVGCVGLRTWLHPYCFLGTPLVDPDVDVDRLWDTVLGALPALRPTPWLDLPKIPADGPVGRSLRRAVATRPTRCTSLGDRSFARRRPQPTYLAEWMSSKGRSELNRKRRVLQRGLGADVATVEQGREDPAGAVARFLELEAAGWKGRAGTAMAVRPGHGRFLQEMADGFAADGRLLGFALEAGPRVLARSIAITAGGGVFGFKRAFDEEFARSSPGTLLDVDLLDWFHGQPDLQWIDTSSDPSRADTDIYGDHMELATTVVGLGRTARHVPALFAAVDAARERLRRHRPAVRRRIDLVRARRARSAQ
ncbi:CelD/BcsL family acetyltransferase involved in cellulose biosynthesis [Actinomycetospora succinea]|uniref:CelD/BcsL family acetyltransferase involved in cellulose biosynthesis n=1 Tax=Actinomycetospora succinea TaxID=663603 RepID=A0A4R6UT79_9PSEU|nr:GNAT family N-acetyltransferase [Actinomycetospora succinea]TDQ48903.1 CelD/BcsL family acetyltransferase involved in cellulose biosynthesis [Actinomycetospora succinea]